MNQDHAEAIRALCINKLLKQISLTDCLHCVVVAPDLIAPDIFSRNFRSCSAASWGGSHSHVTFAY